MGFIDEKGEAGLMDDILNETELHNKSNINYRYRFDRYGIRSVCVALYICMDERDPVQIPPYRSCVYFE